LKKHKSGEGSSKGGRIDKITESLYLSSLHGVTSPAGRQRIQELRVSIQGDSLAGDRLLILTLFSIFYFLFPDQPCPHSHLDTHPRVGPCGGS